jgi:hypothetical protein
MYFLILIITCIFFIIIKDKLKALKLTGIISLVSSIFLIGLTFIIKLIINSSIRFINISNITDYLFMKFVYTSLILLVIGVVEILISKHLYNKKYNKNTQIET